MASVLLVVGNVTLSAGDQQIVDLLDGTDPASSRTDTVEVRSHSDPPANFDAYDGIIESESASSGTFWTNYSALGTLAKPVAVLENGNFDEFRLSTGTSAITNNDRFHLVDDAHYLAAGFAADTTVIGASPEATSEVALTANTGAGAALVWAHTSAETAWKLFAYETGADMTTGTAPARRLAFAMKDASVANMTADGKTLFLTSVEWLLGEDGGGSTDRLARVTWSELEVPNAPRLARVTWSELELADAPRLGRVLWTEMEVPTAPRLGRVTWAELEVPTAPRLVQVTWAELESPDAPTLDRRGIVTWSEMEVPTAPRLVRVTWAEAEVPDAARLGRVLWAEMEAPTAPRVARITWAEMETDAAPRLARVLWSELQVPDVGGGGGSPIYIVQINYGHW